MDEDTDDDDGGNGDNVDSDGDDVDVDGDGNNGDDVGVDDGDGDDVDGDDDGNRRTVFFWTEGGWWIAAIHTAALFQSEVFGDVHKISTCSLTSFIKVILALSLLVYGVHKSSTCSKSLARFQVMTTLQTDLKNALIVSPELELSIWIVKFYCELVPELVTATVTANMIHSCYSQFHSLWTVNVKKICEHNLWTMNTVPLLSALLQLWTMNGKLEQ